MPNQPPPFAQLQQPRYAQVWMRWLVIWLIGIGVGLPLMVILARMGGGHMLNTLVQSATVTINGPTIPSYMLADAITMVLSALIPGLTSGVTTGLAQSLLFRHRLRLGRAWIIASAFGSAIAWWAANALFMSIQNFVIDFLRSTLMLDIGMADIVIAALVAGSVAGYLGGVIVGYAQWLILRRVSSWAMWWIIVSAASWSGLWALGALILAFIALQSSIIN